MYTYRCEKGHDTDEFFKLGRKARSLKCDICGLVAKSIINCRQIGSCWPEGKVFEHVDSKPRMFKNFKELDRYLENKKLSVETLTPNQLKARQEDRRHKLLKGENPTKKVKKKPMKVPEKVDKAFRGSSSVEMAVRALKEDRV